jgi:glycosyltransferase involved in cell wall biosynthesis
MERKNLNIAYICREFGPITGGGIGTYIYNACMSMIAAGHRVFLVSDCFNDENRDLFPTGLELVKVAETRANRVGSFVSPQHEYSYRVYDTLKVLAEQTELDIAEFAEFGVEGFASIRAKRLLGDFSGIKLIVKLHTPSSLLYRINEDRRLHVDSLCDYTMEDYCVKYADMVTSPSLSLGEYFKERVGRMDIRQCPYPMELPEKGGAREFTEKQIRRVRLIGSVQVRKGIDTFIKAAIEVLDVDPDFCFEIWGADRNSLLFGKSYIDIIKRLIPERYKDKIVFCGSVPYEEIPTLFQESCFCVYPSRWENWANVCLEAMSYGCVVLASREGGMGEMVEHGSSGFVIDPLAPGDISGIILEYQSKLEQLAEISANAVHRSTIICDPEDATARIEKNYTREYPKNSWQVAGSDAPLVSVIIPYYNQPQYLEAAIDSVRQSDYPAIEIVVVNDGSTTPSANELFDSLENVVKISKANGGLSSARNAGISAARGDFILPLDSDDLLESSYIRTGVEALMNNPELGYVSCHAQNFGELTNAYIPIGFVPELMPYTNTHGKCSNLYRSEVFTQCGGYDEVMTSYEDWDLLLGLAENGIEGDVIPAEMFHYRRHFDSMVYVTANRQRADLIQYMMIKHEKALAPHAGKMAIMLSRLWKETEIRHEFAQQQIKNLAFSPDQAGDLEAGKQTRCQIYSQLNGTYWEHNSVYIDFDENQWVSLDFNLPFVGQEGVYRLDPSNRPGTLYIHEIKIVEKYSGKVLLTSNGGNGFTGSLVAGTAVKKETDTFLVIVADGEDPQIVLPAFAANKALKLKVTLYYDTDSEPKLENVKNAYRQWSRMNGLLKVVKRLYKRLTG